MSPKLLLVWALVPGIIGLGSAFNNETMNLGGATDEPQQAWDCN